WNHFAGAEHYQIQVSTKADFSTSFLDENITANELEITDLDHGTAYFWRARAADENGFSEWSLVFSFGTEVEIPDTPIAVHPKNNLNDLILPVTFSWKPAARAQSYSIRISEQSDFMMAI